MLDRIRVEHHALIEPDRRRVQRRGAGVLPRVRQRGGRLRRRRAVALRRPSRVPGRRAPRGAARRWMTVGEWDWLARLYLIEQYHQMVDSGAVELQRDGEHYWIDPIDLTDTNSIVMGEIILAGVAAAGRFHRSSSGGISAAGAQDGHLTDAARASGRCADIDHRLHQARIGASDEQETASASLRRRSATPSATRFAWMYQPINEHVARTSGSTPTSCSITGAGRHRVGDIPAGWPSGPAVNGQLAGHSAFADAAVPDELAREARARACSSRSSPPATPTSGRTRASDGRARSTSSARNLRPDYEPTERGKQIDDLLGKFLMQFPIER